MFSQRDRDEVELCIEYLEGFVLDAIDSVLESGQKAKLSRLSKVAGIDQDVMQGLLQKLAKEGVVRPQSSNPKSWKLTALGEAELDDFLSHFD